MNKALICEENPDIIKNIITSLQSLNFETLFASNVNEALLLFDLENPSIVIINEKFGGENYQDNVLIKHIKNLPIYRRREIILIVLGYNFKTGDRITAFANEIDLFFNVKDLHNFLPIVKKLHFEYQTIYKEFKELLNK